MKPSKNKAIAALPGDGTIFALDTDQLRVGDVVLLSQQGLASWAIRVGTRSSHSHAAVLTRPGMLLEAQPEGVRRRSTWGTYATKREWLTVLRPKFDVVQNSQGFSLAQCAENRYGWAYSKIRAIGSPWPKASDAAAWLDGTFCSELVALSFFDYGVDLLPGVRLATVAPGRLKTSKLLADVTASCVRELHPVRNSDAYNLVARVAENDEPTKDMELERRCLDALHTSQRLPPTVRSLHDAFQWLASLDLGEESNAGIDDVFGAALDREGYFEFYESQARELGFGAKPFVDGRQVASNLTSASFTPELRVFLGDLQQMRATFEEGFDARVESLANSRRLATNGSRTLARVVDVQERLLAMATLLRSSRMGLIADLEAAVKR